ncbi:hypothetical protein BASA83_008761 [Batrachochytrium salamandrivorans]|nr:hypothetical protein BASA83_008761 [Batrachochytrium salamandrivorans]
MTEHSVHPLDHPIGLRMIRGRGQVPNLVSPRSNKSIPSAKKDFPTIRDNLEGGHHMSSSSHKGKQRLQTPVISLTGLAKTNESHNQCR